MLSFINNLFKPKTNLVSLVKAGAVIVDVRTKNEFVTGHIQGSKNIPLDRLQQEVQKLKKLNKPIVTVCRSGNRSAMAKRMLSAAGIEVYNGGAWNNLHKQL